MDAQQIREALQAIFSELGISETSEVARQCYTYVSNGWRVIDNTLIILNRLGPQYYGATREQFTQLRERVTAYKNG